MDQPKCGIKWQSYKQLIDLDFAHNNDAENDLVYRYQLKRCTLTREECPSGIANQKMKILRANQTPQNQPIVSG